LKKRNCKRPKEVCDPTPVAVPLGFKRPPTLQEQMKQYIRSVFKDMSPQAAQQEVFVDPDDDMPPSPYEEVTDEHGSFIPAEVLAESTPRRQSRPRSKQVVAEQIDAPKEVEKDK